MVLPAAESMEAMRHTLALASPATRVKVSPWSALGRTRAYMWTAASLPSWKECTRLSSASAVDPAAPPASAASAAEWLRAMSLAMTAAPASRACWTSLTASFGASRWLPFKREDRVPRTRPAASSLAANCLEGAAKAWALNSVRSATWFVDSTWRPLATRHVRCLDSMYLFMTPWRTRTLTSAGMAVARHFSPSRMTAAHNVLRW